MPRISNLAILRAYQENPLLPLLLRECRSHDSAKNELRWLQERASRTITSKQVARSTLVPLGWRRLLRSMCHTRSKGMPLQYILGDQPFGELDILCEKGVLIPRAETETFTIQTAKLILDNIQRHGRHEFGQQQGSFRIVDLCTGSGCISLLLHALLAPHIGRLSILGIDLSPAAIGLANKNLARNVQQGLLSNRAAAEVSFQHGNVLTHDSTGLPSAMEVLRNYQGLSFDREPKCDVVISNPPYISPESFRDGTTSRSVRVFEPKLALVPTSGDPTIGLGLSRQADLFYYHIILLSFQIRAKLVVLECGDHSQARRVSAIVKTLSSGYRLNSLSIEIWSSSGTPISDETSSEHGPCAVVLHNWAVGS
ncbi:S-adenosyl-L-methionine-dependent methyltransferase [Aspergillus pseudonomiae]|uniref:S-adenosyl-L-methionine-dependent methyltransferase n=1 Tax=Aspergillus pseudonomiae TaxID=1506151 RepID=A0A5N6HJC8_9EURO|nr:S-adenosyl-L-methionine-dependent methyltransferase [Aspergillus pseudonomiae]KAB8253964.1 S-adenosyl-L-methionine-dependent methyltransferase [Aspergillus pseudonomiae]KAE8397330.1 S-adenosyl-L-methionine-dependent methyltransferase [Aspergillus pseudonomiae]